MSKKQDTEEILQQEMEQARLEAERLSANIIEHKLPVNLKHAKIIPLNDLHIGDRHTDMKAIHTLIKNIYNSKDTYVALLGDLMNNGLKNSKTNSYEETMSPHRQKMWLLDELYCIRDKIICVINGNHENRTSKDSDAHPLLDLAIALLGKDEGTRLYRDDAAFMKISVGSRPNKQRQISYNIFATHGSGGGRVGAGINRLQLVSMFLEGIDLVMMGHTHQQATHTYSKIVFDDKNMVLRQRPVKCLISGAWQNYGGYAMKGMLTPSAKGESIILLNGQHKELKLLS